ncbi:7-cyano-7-deazaguanine synthase [Anoxybacillus flavithermus]
MKELKGKLIKRREGNSVLILLSGGLDSCALVHYYLSKHYKVKALHFDYGQSSKSRERQAVELIAKYYKIDVQIATLGFPLNERKGEYVGRNALFLLAAANLLPVDVSKISLGIHSGTPYYDCSHIFIEDCTKILDGYFAGSVTLEAPFIDFTKAQIYEYCVRERVPIYLTYSCERGYKEPCGECLSCIDRSVLIGF